MKKILLIVTLFFGLISFGMSQDSLQVKSQNQHQKRHQNQHQNKFVDENGDGINDNQVEKLYRNRNVNRNRNRNQDGTGPNADCPLKKETQSQKGKK